jgi:DNA-directed RNA polymerase specialized sigma24 family protein
MTQAQPDWQNVGDAARAFLRRHRDPWTVRERDDLVQESLLQVWSWVDGRECDRRVFVAARTIAHRLRCRGLRRFHRRAESVGGDALAELTEEILPERHHRLLGHLVPHDWLVQRLAAGLAGLGALDRALLLGRSEGRALAELATEHGCTPQAAKARVCRARRRLRTTLLAAIRNSAVAASPF